VILFNRIRQIYVPILTQITVPYLLLAMAVATGATLIVTRLFFDSVEERFANQLVETAVLADESMVREEQNLLVNLRLLSNIQGVDAAVQAGDTVTLRELVLPTAFNSNVQAIVVLQERGRKLLAVQLNPENQNYETLSLNGDLASLPFVQNVLTGVEDDSGDKFGGLIATDLEDFLFISGPVRDANGTLQGTMLVGIAVNRLTAQIRAETGGQLSFYSSDGQGLASTFSQSNSLSGAQAQEILVRQNEGSLIRPLEEGGLSYSELLSAWELRGGDDLGVMGVALPTHFIVQASQFTRNNILLLTSSTLFLVALVGLLVARRITGPIRGLKEAAQRVAQGNLQVKVPQHSRDEVGLLAQSFNEMVANLSHSKKDLLDAYDETIEGWARAMDLRDHETEGHSRRVADLFVALASVMGIKGQQLVDPRRGALLHDVGKIAVPDSILLKKGKLTAEEMAEMRKHPVFAKQFMEQIEFLKPALDIPTFHHEKWDGSGYSNGLKGEQIPLVARIFAVVDVWDALTSDRPYRQAWGFDETMNYITEESGHHFDPAVVKAFKKLMGR